MQLRTTTRVGIDTGGTFTDVVYLGPEGRRTAKVPSTPSRPEDAFLAALDAVDAEGARISHGTTVGTNAVLTRSGARVAFVTTAGFEDLPWIGRGHRDDLHALSPARTAPLLEHRCTHGLAERVDARGRVLRAPSKTALARLRREVAAHAPEAIAVCLLHAVQNGGHERRVRAALKGLGVPVHVSAAVCADPRETERATTVILDAYVSPILRRYLRAVARCLPPAARRAFTVMRSDGGRMTVAEVERAPVRTLLSGPAAGVAAAAELAARVGEPRALSFDVGGTSTDVAWIEGRDLAVRPALRVGTFKAGVPSVGLETVGAGGGSVIQLDAGGALRVGPQSAGAEPGPACYGRGGPFTLTDAWLLLGHVPRALLGGAFPLEAAAAERAARRLARDARTTLPRLCKGAVAVAAATTARALRLASVSGGHDPRHAALVAFGGAGPVLAAQTAERLGITRVYVPADPGTFAAQGALLAPLRADAARVVTSLKPAAFAGISRALGKRVRKALEREGALHVTLRAEVDARYAGQAFEVTVPYDAHWQRAFHERHAAHYGFADSARPVEGVRLRVRGEGREDPAPESGRIREPARYRTRPVRGTQPLARSTLRAGMRVRGPQRIDEVSGTTWVPAGWTAELPGQGLLRLRRSS